MNETTKSTKTVRAVAEDRFASLLEPLYADDSPEAGLCEAFSAEFDKYERTMRSNRIKEGIRRSRAAAKQTTAME